MQLGWDEWQIQAADAIELLGGERDARRARRVRECGSMYMLPVCKHCGTHLFEHKQVSADCESRVCPRCAREHAQKQRKKLRTALRQHPVSRHGQSWWLHTLTVRRPEGTSIERIQEDAGVAWEAWRQVWYGCLKPRGATGAHVELEVSPGGMVHIHALVRSPWMGPDVLAQIREGIEPLTGGKQYNIRRVRKHRTAVAEVAKYLTKGVARKDGKAVQTHPLLAAMVDVALRGVRTIREYGKLWRELPEERDDGEGFVCPCCGGKDFGAVYLTAEQLKAVETAEKARAA